MEPAAQPAVALLDRRRLPGISQEALRRTEHVVKIACDTCHHRTNSNINVTRTHTNIFTMFIKLDNSNSTQILPTSCGKKRKHQLTVSQVNSQLAIYLGHTSLHVSSPILSCALPYIASSRSATVQTAARTAVLNRVGSRSAVFYSRSVTTVSSSRP
jgi:hypothetical protein